MTVAQAVVTTGSTTVDGLPAIEIDILGPSLSGITATVIRDDGTYVLGASPLNPVPLTGGTATVFDFTAPYGLPVTYVVNLTASAGGTPDYSPPSVPSLPVTMGQAPDTVTLYNRLGWAADEDETGVLLQWLSGIAQMAQAIDSVAWDGYDTDGVMAPGWSQVLDINRCPTDWLPWLAQFVGVRLDPGARDDQQRYAIENPQGWARGTPAAILATANRFLAPGYSATLLERDTSPYHLTIEIPTGAYAGSSTCLELSHEYANCGDLIGAFATCVDLWKDLPTGSFSGATTCATVAATYATCLVLMTTVATCADLWTTDFFISTAIAEAVPAGISVTLVYT